MSCTFIFTLQLIISLWMGRGNREPSMFKVCHNIFQPSTFPAIPKSTNLNEMPLKNIFFIFRIHYLKHNVICKSFTYLKKKKSFLFVKVWDWYNNFEIKIKKCAKNGSFNLRKREKDFIYHIFYGEVQLGKEYTILVLSM